MNRYILLFFTLMIVALVGASAASASDVDAVNDVEIDSVNDTIVVDEINDSVAEEDLAIDEEDVAIDEENVTVAEDVAVDVPEAEVEPVANLTESSRNLSDLTKKIESFSDDLIKRLNQTHYTSEDRKKISESSISRSPFTDKELRELINKYRGENSTIDLEEIQDDDVLNKLLIEALLKQG